MEVAEGGEGPQGGRAAAEPSPSPVAARPSPSPLPQPQPRLASKVVVPSPHAYDPRRVSLGLCSITCCARLLHALLPPPL